MSEKKWTRPSRTKIINMAQALGLAVHGRSLREIYQAINNRLEASWTERRANA